MKNNSKTITNPFDTSYHSLLKDVLEKSSFKDDRTQTGTYSVFGRQLRFDLSQGFPLLTTKKVFLRGIIIELLWFLQGSSNIKYLVDNNVHIWNDWPYKYYKQTALTNDLQPLSQEEFVEKIKNNDAFAEKWGELGPVYGVQWRKWKSPDGTFIDQIQNVIQLIQNDPTDRRMIVSAWNVADIEAMKVSGLPPCHTMFQFYVDKDDRLSCQLYQRSADLFLGVPFNIASYALLTLMVAHVTHKKPGDFIHTFGDVHIYSNHLEQVQEQLTRTPRKQPKLKITRQVHTIDDFEFDDFELVGYDPHPPIKAPIAV